MDNIIAYVEEYTKMDLNLLKDVFTPIQVNYSDNPLLQQLTLSTPYAFILESCNFSKKELTLYQFSPGYHHSVSFSIDHPMFQEKRSKHKHDFIEIMYVLSGSVKNYIENKSYVYQTGQCCIMNRNIQHCEEYSSDFQVLFIMLSPQFLEQFQYWNYQYKNSEIFANNIDPTSELINNLTAPTSVQKKVYLDYSPLISAERSMDSTYQIFNLLVINTVNQYPGFLFQIGASLSSLFALLNDEAKFCCKKMRVDFSGQEFLFIKIEQLFASCNRSYSRKELEEIFGYNSEYLNRIIKKYTGLTLNQYEKKFSMKEAQRQILETDKSISQIIHDLGYSNNTYFYRIFKNEFGLTPGKLRSGH